MSHRAIYWIVGGVMALLLAVMLITYNYNKANEEALAKAEQLITALDEAGLATPTDPNNVARVFGNDGGAVCASVDDGVALGIAKLNLSVGGAFYIRPVIADGRLRTGLLIIVQTYCPEKVPTAEEFLDSHNFDTVVRG
jgi:type II secretory pathway pseudopilin PulG